MAAKEVENWDDDLDLNGPIFTQSTSTHAPSISSRLSFRSESNAGEDDWNVPLAVNDEKSTSNAISSAKLAGIPIPTNVPASALLGGTIKRLGKKKSRQHIADDWGEDLELPSSNHDSLKIKTASFESEAPADDLDDLDWADGSLGVRFGGTRRASKNRSSSASAMSPSVTSNMTLESEEDGLGGLVLPTGPVDFENVLKKRKDAPTVYPARVAAASSKDLPTTPVNALDSQRDDFFADIDFGTGDVFDPTKNTLNRNIKPSWKPPRDSTSAGTKIQTSLTFTDKTANTRLPRPVTSPKSTRLEPVYETGASNLLRARRPEPTTTNAQLLRSKRSMPALRQHQPLSKTPSIPYLAPSNPGLQNRQAPARFSQHSRRDSDPTRPQSPSLRLQSRLSTAMGPETPTRQRRDVAPSALAREAAARKTVTRPARRRNFGDGSELETFDDLPTSAVKESLYTKAPTARAQPRMLRSQQSQSKLGARDKMTTPMPGATPKSPTKAENLPRFARDTAASRIAREQTIGSSKPRSDGPLMPRTNWSAQIAARTPNASPTSTRNRRKGPQLVAHMGKENIRHFQEDAATKGMHWNATRCCWEGNENDVADFDPPAPPSPPRPALITNIQGSQGVQVVGGMVFDPSKMCWLKLGDSLSPSAGEDDDPFRDIEDLPDEHPTADTASVSGTRSVGGTGDWLVGEEFDLGPEFIRRQREEEENWRARVGAWFGEGRDGEGERWKWSIRDIAATATLQ